MNKNNDFDFELPKFKLLEIDLPKFDMFDVSEHMLNTDELLYISFDDYIS